MNRRTNILIATLALLSASALQAGTIWTLDGKTYDGETKVESDGNVSITQKTGTVKVPLKNILMATLASPQVSGGSSASKLPGDLRYADIGNTGKPGLPTFFQGTFKLQGAGSDADKKNDAFNYVYQLFNGEGAITARILDVPATKENSRAGLMFRASPESSTFFASLTAASDGTIEFRYRAAANADFVTAGTAKAKFPIWLRLSRQRAGKDYVAEYSTNAKDWTTIGATPAAATAARPNPLVPAASQPATIPATRPAVPATLPATNPLNPNINPRFQPRQFGGGNPAVIPGGGRRGDAVVIGGSNRNPTEIPGTIPMNFRCYAGLIVSANSTAALASAEVDSFSLKESKGITSTDQQTSPPVSLTAAPIELIGRGILTKSGTFLSNATPEEADGDRIKFNFAGNRLIIPLTNLARITAEPLSPGLLARIPADTPGVLSRTGDFMEGETSSIERKIETTPQGNIQKTTTAKISSVIFGLASFRLDNGETTSLILRDTNPADTAWRIVMTDGSVLLADSITPDKDRLTISERSLGKLSINASQIFVIRAAADSASSLLTMKPEKVDGPENFDPASISIFDKDQGPWLFLTGGPCPAGIISPATGVITWNLEKDSKSGDKKFKSLITRIGVPERVPARATAKFIILADGKELYKSKPMTSKDTPELLNLKIEGVKTLTLKIEADSASELSAYGLWGDPMLLK